jgi:hypothetical protein
MKKIIAERAAYHNDQIRKCDTIINNPETSEAFRTAAFENKACARACLAELIIIENRISLLNFLQK